MGGWDYCKWQTLMSGPRMRLRSPDQHSCIYNSYILERTQTAEKVGGCWPTFQCRSRPRQILDWSHHTCWDGRSGTQQSCQLGGHPLSQTLQCSLSNREHSSFNIVCTSPTTLEGTVNIINGTSPQQIFIAFLAMFLSRIDYIVRSRNWGAISGKFSTS